MKKYRLQNKKKAKTLDIDDRGSGEVLHPILYSTLEIVQEKWFVWFEPDTMNFNYGEQLEKLELFSLGHYMFKLIY